MTTAYSSLLGLALPVTGELSGTWGDTVNDYITNYLDAAVAGTQSITTDADVTLTKTTGTALGATSSQYAILNCTGARTALRTITAPAASKIYMVINATTGGYAVKLVGAGPTTGLTIPNGASAVVAWNGSDFVEVGSGTIGNLTVNGNLSVTGNTTLGDAAGDTTTVSGPMTLSAGTANGVLYLNGSKVATSGSALTFDGTTLAFGSTGQRITGDLANATSSNRLLFQNSTVNGNSNVGAIPNGTSTTASFVAYNASDANNASTAQLLALSTTVRVNAGQTGTGTYLPITFFTNGSEQMRLDTSGNLGIGTSSPVTKLEVNGIIAQTSQGTSSAQIRAVNSGGTFYFGLDNSTGSSFGTAYAAALWHSGNYPMLFATNGAERMRLDSSGNLGLGVTPTSGWEAGAAMQFSSEQSYGKYGYTRGAYYDGSTYRAIGTLPAAQLQISGGGFLFKQAAASTAGAAITLGTSMTLDASGNLGLGVTPGVKLDIGSGTLRIKNATGDASGLLILQDTSDTAKIINYYNGPLVFGTNNTERARITNTGDLLVAGTNTGAAGIAIAVARNYSFGEGSGESYVNLFRQNSSAATVLANGYKYSGTANGFASSISSSWAKCAIGLGVAGGAITFYTNTAATVANGTDVTPTERMRLDTSGNLGLGTSSATTRLDVINSGGGQQGIRTNSTGAASTANSGLWLVGNCASTQYNWMIAAQKNVDAALEITPSTAVGGGTFSAPTAIFTQAGSLQLAGGSTNTTYSSNGQLAIKRSNSSPYISFHQDDGTRIGFLQMQAGSESALWVEANQPLRFATNNTERARITSGGNLLVGSTGISTSYRFEVVNTGVGKYGGIFKNDDQPSATLDLWNASTSGNAVFVGFYTEATATGRGSITYNRAGGLVAYNTTSDYRLKTLVAPVTGSGARLDALNPVEYEWKETGHRARGFFAHEFQQVYADSVTGEKDAVDEEGKPVYQAMQASTAEVIADLVAEIKSLRARVAQLEAKG